MGKKDAVQVPGLRERKKQQTRLALSEVATRLFIERGFDRVTIAEVAEAAQVSVNTVFNYFETKEELFFDREAEVVGALGRIVHERGEGESPLEAMERSFRGAVKARTGPFRRGNYRPFLAAVEASPALKARARLMLEKAELQLSRMLAGEGMGEDDARALASLVTGLFWMLTREFQQAVLRGEPEAAYLKRLSRLADAGFRTLREGAPRFKPGRRRRTPGRAPSAATSR